MAKKPQKSKKSRSSSSSASASTSSNSTKNVSKGKMVLRIKSSENTRRSTRLQSVVGSQKERSPSLVAKSKMKVKKKKKNEKFDAKKPKKPPTAFFYFLEDFRKEFQEQNPDVKSMREVGKACGEKWKTMTYEEKVKYYDIATEKRAEFDRAMADYIKKKESGEDEVSEDGSEFDE